MQKQPQFINETGRMQLRGRIAQEGGKIGTFPNQIHIFFEMIRGTTHDQDARFCDKIKRMLEKSEWPDKYDIKIDLTKVDLELMKVWIEKKLISILGEEDDIISGTIISLIEQSLEKQQKLNAKNFHIAISGFLLEKTLTFVSQLWDLMDEAQRSARGIPESLLQEKLKTQELQRKKLEELNAKRYKINSHKFSNVVKRFTNNRDDRNYEERQEKEHKKKKNRERSRSRSDEKKKHRRTEEKRKHRSRQKQPRSKSKQKRNKDLESRQRRQRSPSSESQKRDRHRSHKQKKASSPSNKSDSSGVVSSSNSNDN